jgi:YHS domain-containing protein
MLAMQNHGHIDGRWSGCLCWDEVIRPLKFQYNNHCQLRRSGMQSLKVLSMVFLLATGFIALRPAISYAQEQEAAKPEVAISGFCPVCVLKGAAVKGSDNYVTEYKGKIYKFAGFDQQKMFIEDPETYTTDLDAKFRQLNK